jgi:hypothetical protein
MVAHNHAPPICKPHFQFEESRARRPRGSHIKVDKASLKQAQNTTHLFVRSISTDPQSDVARARSWAAIYVQDFDAPCVLQFAWISALCCALHRSTSQVIHRSGSYNSFCVCKTHYPRFRSSGAKPSDLGQEKYRASVLASLCIFKLKERAQGKGPARIYATHAHMNILLCSERGYLMEIFFFFFQPRSGKDIHI